MSVASQVRDLTEARAEFDWLRAGSTVAQQGALRDLDRAFTNFFVKNSGHPKFQKRSGARQGFVARDLVVRRINRRWGEILVPTAGGAVPDFPGLGRYFRGDVGSDRVDEWPVDGEFDDSAAASPPTMRHSGGGD